MADYGGTDAIGGEIVGKMLSLEGVNVEEGDRSQKINLFVNGSKEKDIVPEYHVLDYDNGVDLLKPISGEKFDAGICMDLLEHTSNPFLVAKNIGDSLKKGAYFFVTVPWIWELHYHPKDYWRFTPQGLKELFPEMEEILTETIRDPEPEEKLPRARIVAIFKKI